MNAFIKTSLALHSCTRGTAGKIHNGSEVSDGRVEERAFRILITASAAPGSPQQLVKMAFPGIILRSQTWAVPWQQLGHLGDDEQPIQTTQSAVPKPANQTSKIALH
ncbi:hypothetical protein TRAPUB_4410 [Trametes pubescens]|uniref:Uncharacterized protein n=1 Tax=Trametes pubescens TaxID=154538 RepID=A0A1M2VB43_TRAPU|nr:hypothetical protein TRAPUB_4410 [Trametes pubescens]